MTARAGAALARAAALGAGATTAGCTGPLSALEPAGDAADVIATLFWWMAAGAVVIWLAVVALALYAIYRPPRLFSRRAGAMLVVGGGVVFPLLVLTALLVHGLALLPRLLAPAPDTSLRIAVAGEQWWWRVRYLRPGGAPVELANEIRLPVGEPVEFTVTSPDVIHSFWIPSLAGKIDMIPGRVTRLAFRPTRTGVFRGTCAEYCGIAHALMSFVVVVLEREQFARWLARQAEPAAPPASPDVARGQAVFLASGCAACHAVRGTPARGVIGPDLTHVG
ncbi:MAG TPA: cytochrome c oxidase subunit II, partial [Candidatus Tectomicrobia bacterium]|nr:cytochrome c oxidase subunit II [Candidatus Tectomicrobia bacterium]